MYFEHNETIVYVHDRHNTTILSIENVLNVLNLLFFFFWVIMYSLIRCLTILYSIRTVGL